MKKNILYLSSLYFQKETIKLLKKSFNLIEIKSLSAISSKKNLQ